MKDFILDQELKNVKDKHTQNYLKEVVSTFYNENYRSCIVVLYSVVIFDFIQKLSTLRDSYNDKKAEDILVNLESKQNHDDKYSSIETELIKQICESTHLLNEVEKKQIYEMRNYRNLAAHPVLDNNFELINPTKEQTLAHIRNMFESVFLKDAILSKKIKDDFLADVEDYYSRNAQNPIDRLEEYVRNKYYSRFDETVSKYMFKDLWCFCFFANDEQCNKNRKAVLHSLISLVKTNTSMFIKVAEANKQYYNSKVLITASEFDNNIFPSYYDNQFISFIYFISLFPEFYSLVVEHIRIEITNLCEKNININMLAYFVDSSYAGHIDKVIESHKKMYMQQFSIKYPNDKLYNILDGACFKVLIDKAYNYDSAVKAKKFAMDYFCESTNFNCASRIFQEIISPMLHLFTYDEIKYLVSNMNKNSQIIENRDFYQYTVAINNILIDGDSVFKLEIVTNINQQYQIEIMQVE